MVRGHLALSDSDSDESNSDEEEDDASDAQNSETDESDEDSYLLGARSHPTVPTEPPDSAPSTLRQAQN